MLDLRGWLLYVLAPLLAVLLVDQATKASALSLTQAFELGPLRLALLRNPGFAFGTLGELSKLYTVVVPATIGGLVLFVFIVLQDFLPVQSPTMRVGASIFVGGVTSNLLDRVRAGSVVDFLQLRATDDLATAVFNVSDALQWVGVALLLGAYAANGRLLYPVAQRRGRKWIDPLFQGRFTAILLAVGAGFALTLGLLSYTFLRFAIGEVSRLGAPEAALFTRTFLYVYAAATATFFLLLAVAGIHLSHRIVGPIKGFENFLDDLMRGKNRQFRLRRTDDLKQLEAMADRFYALFHERLGVTPPRLEPGEQAPSFEATTSTGDALSANDLAGRKVWMIFYRYATCPLCAVHLDDIRATVRDVQARGVAVVAVYESTVEDFQATDGDGDAGAATRALLASMAIPLIADPDRRLYRQFGAGVGLFGLLRPSVLRTFLAARRRGFRQGRILGALGQLPAHFLIDDAGVIVRAFYGTSAVDHLELAEVRAFAGL